MRKFSSVRLVLLISALSTTTILSACQTKGRVSGAILPPVSDVVPAAAERPPIRKGDNAKVVALKYRNYGDQNKHRLGQARSNYEAVRSTYAAP
jgi:hypothetical protein